LAPRKSYSGVASNKQMPDFSAKAQHVLIDLASGDNAKII